MNVEKFLQDLSFTSPAHLTSNIIVSVIVIVALFLIRLVIIRTIKSSVESPHRRHRWGRNTSYIIILVGLFVLGIVWFKGSHSVGTFFGLLAAGLAISLQSPVTSLVGWIYINIFHPFNMGDRIQVGNNERDDMYVKGDVIDIRLFKFTVLEIGTWIHSDQSTGRIIHVPNHAVFSKQLANYTSDFEFIWNEIEVLVTYESDWKKAKKNLQKIADAKFKDSIEHAKNQIERANKSYLVHYKHLTPIIYTEAKESGINLRMRYLCNPRQRTGVINDMWEKILDMVETADDIELAYPTMTIKNEQNPGADQAN